MKILITGGTGFIGSHLVYALAQKGHQIVVISYRKRQNRQNIKFYKINICSPKIDLIFKKERPDIVYHLAAYTFIKTEPSWESINNIIKHNILGSLRIIEASHKYKVKKIIFSSSVGVYGVNKSSILSEKMLTNPTSFYGISKLTVEKILETHYNVYKMPYIIFRYANVYGPGQKLIPATAVLNFINKLLNNKQPTINGTGKQSRDFIYIDDVIRANLAALKTKKVGTYNVGTGKTISLNKLFSKICKILNKNIRPKYNRLISGGPQKYLPDINKIKKDLDWQPKIKIDDGLQKTVDYFKSKNGFIKYKN